MNDIYITLTGNVAAEPRQYSFEDGARVTSLRVLTTHRYFDKRTGQWADGERVCFAVRCWRALGDNVAKSVQVGQPVVVSGKLRIREFGPEGDRRFMPEVEASSVGHDLRWGTGVFAKPERGGGTGSVSKEMRDRLDEETQDWAMGTKPAPDRLTTTRVTARVDARMDEGSAPRVAEEQKRGPDRPAEPPAVAAARPTGPVLADEVLAPGHRTASQQDRPTSPPHTSEESGTSEEGHAPTRNIKDQISASVLGTGSRSTHALESTTTGAAAKRSGPAATKQPNIKHSASSPSATSPTGDASTDLAPTHAEPMGAASADAASAGSAPTGTTLTSPPSAAAASTGLAPGAGLTSTPSTAATPTGVTSAGPASTRPQSRGALSPAGRRGGATVRILGADDNESEAEDAGWPTEERAAA
ncbi:single-stranded DNA-binding protein [Nonomuraea sp. CA-143628]|uniref:single-stranded DNA-binding protein n=1 Tax=Nonomuraea sp. CA-143628 TaxID=3239997 RepID=UPI003D8B3692